MSYLIKVLVHEISKVLEVLFFWQKVLVRKLNPEEGRGGAS